MDKNAIKKYAVWARQELITRVSQRALQYGITDGDIVPATAASVNGAVLSAEEMKQRKALIEKINAKSYTQVMEEVAYTWFNRFSALRFMEVNGYLPTHVRVFTDEENRFKPQILTEAIHLELDGLDMETVYRFKTANDDDGLFKYLVITQCNALSLILPGMFQKIADYTELLFPDNLLRQGSVIQRMLEWIPEDDWKVNTDVGKDAVQIIGWLYQYYNSEKKDKVFAALKKNVKITKENIPAATQLFTPDWIVRYMVENSLGRLWLERMEHFLGDVQDLAAVQALRSNWKYYLDEAEQESSVRIQLDAIIDERGKFLPSDIKCIDPCAGSGHILAYMFDVLIQIYESYGYTDREAVRSIIEHNLYGLDIDDRAAQLAYFAVMMKARQYDRRFLTRKDEDCNPDVPQPHVYAICESNGIDAYALDYFVNGEPKLKSAMGSIIKEMCDAKEYGSILNITPVDFAALYARFDEVYEDISMSRETVLNDLLLLVHVAQTMAQKYDVVVTNPPYMAVSNTGDKVNAFIKSNYPNSKVDLYAVFIEKCSDFAKTTGYQAMITQHTWMFIASYEGLRKKLMHEQFVNMAHLGARAFGEIAGEVVQTTTFVKSNFAIKNYQGRYVRLVDQKSEAEKEEAFHIPQYHYIANQSDYALVPRTPFVYWANKNIVNLFGSASTIRKYFTVRNGLTTGNNDIFLRLWFEVNSERKQKWFPCNKGGQFRKWYGNREYLIDWENDGFELKNFFDEKGKQRSTLRSIDYNFKPCLVVAHVASGELAYRYIEGGFISESAVNSIYQVDEKVHLIYALAALNSKPCNYIAGLFNPTLGISPEDISNIPLVISNIEDVEALAAECVQLSKGDWDSYETSWDFKTHPLVLSKMHKYAPLIDENGEPIEYKPYSLERTYNIHAAICRGRFQKLKANEEELNRIFINIYGLQDELTPEVEDKDVTVRKADLSRDIRSLISYAVGCMFGRYSLDELGLAYAGGNWDAGKYKTFPADKDNIVPICDDEYFEDDIVGRFVKFVEVVYGKETLDENLRFIADALGGKGQPRDVIRNYFLNDFFNDHCRIYQKRPIYWQFDSGKKNGFKCLIYMHRYQPDTLARIRTDYVHEQQSRYRTAIADLEQRMASASTAERVKLTKQMKKLQEQAEEIHVYEEKIHHLADQMIPIDLDDGVKHNYELFKDVLAKIK